MLIHPQLTKEKRSHCLLYLMVFGAWQSRVQCLESVYSPKSKIPEYRCLFIRKAFMVRETLRLVKIADGTSEGCQSYH